MHRLDDIFDYSFDLLALLCSAKPHKLAWIFNHKLHLHFQRDANLCIKTRDNAAHSFLHYSYQTDHAKVRLVRNKSLEARPQAVAFILPELSQYDYFLLIDDPTNAHNFDKVKAVLRNLPTIEHQLLVDASTLKNKENLMFYYG